MKLDRETAREIEKKATALYREADLLSDLAIAAADAGNEELVSFYHEKAMPILHRFFGLWDALEILGYRPMFFNRPDGVEVIAQYMNWRDEK